MFKNNMKFLIIGPQDAPLYKYIHYDNFNGIDINETKKIPYYYEGYMGVPITFM